MGKKKATAQQPMTPSRAYSRNAEGEILRNAKLTPQKASQLGQLLCDVADLVKKKEATASFVSEMSKYSAQELTDTLTKLKVSLSQDDASVAKSKKTKPKVPLRTNVSKEEVSVFSLV